MEFFFQIKMNEKLFIRNPEDTELGKKIIKHSIQMIYESGIESFTFKKLAASVHTTEAGIYRYFENKHRLLVYIVSWYWSWLEYQVIYHTHNIKNPVSKLKLIIRLLTADITDTVSFKHIDQDILREIVIAEGTKAYLTKNVTEDNKDKLFKPYKDLCARIADVILECNPDYPFSHSLSSTIIEEAKLQTFFMKHLPSLTDFGKSKDKKKVIRYLENIVFSALQL